MVYQIGICDNEASTCVELENILNDYFKISDFEVQIKYGIVRKIFSGMFLQK